ncbi:MAG: helix-turn-helix domain-containing protein [Erysipelotrichaceae bacterium]|nr:helix-turn-helix domain-containing protein [Erysipelotrichaceae bacterium]MCI9312522.1 helix-turn-helix domain-containing protein [Erysipelotrichaceae bacterium]MCI9523936.1 helix-turn-helix domain-containing protein [Erysipelotrichaceae bacterium]
MSELQMLTLEQVAEITGVHRDTVTMWREIGIIKAIKTGKGYMFSQEEIRQFQRDYRGHDISNKVKAIESYNLVNAIH